MKPLKVKELIAALKSENPEALIALSSDVEGNSYSLMANEQFVLNNAYLKKTLDRQDTYFEKEEILKPGETVKDYLDKECKKKDLVECVILFPID